jgi:predicted nuclease of predicted toxin-antitoxin system
VKFKLDENIGRRGLESLKASGHDVMTVVEQGLRHITDEELFEICSAEGRTLVTLDRDFDLSPRLLRPSSHAARA